MKTISLADAHKILMDCAGVVWDDFILFPSVSDLDSNGNNDFMSLRAEDDEGQIFTARFVQNENERVKVAVSSMFLIDDEGAECQLSILDCNDKAFDECENIGKHEI